MHELKPRSLGGKRSKRNSIAACGDGVNGCHGFAQRHEIEYIPTELGAEGTVQFQAKTPTAADWMRVTLFHWIESPVMVDIEEAS